MLFFFFFLIGDLEEKWEFLDWTFPCCLLLSTDVQIHAQCASCWSANLRGAAAQSLMLSARTLASKLKHKENL